MFLHKSSPELARATVPISGRTALLTMIELLMALLQKQGLRLVFPNEIRSQPALGRFSFHPLFGQLVPGRFAYREGRDAK